MKCDFKSRDIFDASNKRILIIKPSSLGDVVHTVPLVSALKRTYPSSYISWIIQKSFTPVVQNLQSLNEYIPIFIPSTSDPGSRLSSYLSSARATIQTVRSLRSKFQSLPFDYVLDLHASFRSAILGRTNPHGKRIGFADAKELNTYFQDVLVFPNPDKIHAVDKNYQFADLFGCCPSEADFKLPVGHEQEKFVHDFFREQGIKDEKVIYANPAARWKSKYWIPGYWAQLVDLLYENIKCAVVFGGSPEDIDYINQIASMATNKPLISAGKLTLAQSIALIAKCDLYVGVDSGPMHIAAFTDTPVVAIFGPTDPKKVGPYGNGHVVLQSPSVNCLACRKRDCERMECMKTITPEVVFRSAESLLK